MAGVMEPEFKPASHENQAQALNRQPWERRCGVEAQGNLVGIDPVFLLGCRTPLCILTSSEDGGPGVVFRSVCLCLRTDSELSVSVSPGATLPPDAPFSAGHSCL